MFYSSKPNKEGGNPSLNLIGSDTQIEGVIRAKERLRLDGKLTGDLIGEAKIMIAESGIVEGTIVCNDIEIAGIVNGKIEAKGLLTLRSTARVMGDIKYHKLEVDPGANLQCSLHAIAEKAETLKVVGTEESVAS